MNNDILSLDDYIEYAPQDQNLLTPGTYPFQFVDYTTGEYKGNEQHEGCPTVDLTLTVYNGQKSYTVKHRFFLRKTAEDVISVFFASVGLMKNGQRGKLIVLLEEAKGLTGRCKVDRKEIQTKTGPRCINVVRKFYPKQTDSYTQRTQDF